MAETLWDWIQEAADKCNISIPSHTLPFTTNSNLPSSILRSEGSNRVLVFPGAFNPPHKGHIQLLNSIREDTLKLLHIRGVIIFPHDDEHIQHKTELEQFSLGLTKSRRLSLWGDAEGFPKNDTWIFGGSRKSLVRLQKQLQGDLRRKNISLSFLLLVGPDWITTHSIYDPWQWKCTEAITSDVCRLVDFRCEYTLRQLPGCSDWTLSTFRNDIHNTPFDAAEGRNDRE
jgi:nicotinic acid mononucleotide adenylyltransferase